MRTGDPGAGQAMRTGDLATTGRLGQCASTAQSAGWRQAPVQPACDLVLVAAEAIRVLRKLQLRKGPGLDLAHSLARYAYLGSDVLQGHRAGR
jgi:hypothetical protein